MIPDLELVRRYLKGDSSALREVIERYQSDVLGLCIRLMRHRQDAEDVVQDVFVRVFRSLNRWDQERTLKPWILGIAVNRCRTAMGKRAKRPTASDYLAEMPGKEVPPVDRELAEALAEEVSSLRTEYREVFVLFHETGRNYEEIAEIVGRPVGTVKTWIHRARQALSDRLRERGLMPEEPVPTPEGRAK